MKKRKKEAIDLLPYMLKSIREVVGIPQTELAQTLGISRQLMAQWESGRTTPSKEQLSEWLKWILREIDFLRGYDKVTRSLIDLLREEGKWRPVAAEQRNKTIPEVQVGSDIPRDNPERMRVLDELIEAGHLTEDKLDDFDRKALQEYRKRQVVSAS